MSISNMSRAGDRRQNYWNATRREAVNASGAVVMDDHPHAIDNAIDQTEQELLISTVSDEALEKAACGTSWAQTYPQTCVATICVGDALFPTKLSGQTRNAR
jgi:hypothetical protein